MLKNVYIAAGMRTAFGSFNGGLSSFSAPELGSFTIRATLEKAGVKGADVDEVYFGNVISAGVGQAPARQAAIKAGIPVQVPCVTVNKMCGSAMTAVILSAQAIQAGDAGLCVAGGCESMTNAPYLLKKARSGYRMGHGELIDSMIFDGLWDVYTNKHMGSCGDQCANKFQISREDQDTYAIQSYTRALKSWNDGFYKSAVTPVQIKSKKGVVVFERDEDVDRFQGDEKLRALPPAFGPDSRVTAGNASGINDGAASMLVFGDEKKQALGLKPTAKILGYAGVALEPDWFTVAPIHAIRKLCDRLSIRLQDVDLFEINEAFSVVPLAAMRELKIDRERVNVVGGAVAIGHPIGSTGARIINTLAQCLHQQDKRLGIACLCIGGGEATAIAIERCSK